METSLLVVGGLVLLVCCGVSRYRPPRYKLPELDADEKKMKFQRSSARDLKEAKQKEAAKQLGKGSSDA